MIPILLLSIVFLFKYIDGHDLKGVGGEPITFLMHAAKNGNIDKINDLLKSKVSINESSRSHMTALHYALGFQQEDAAVLLVKSGANINALDNWNNSPLSMARTKKLNKAIEAIEKKFLDGNHFYENLDNKDKHFVLLIASYNNKEWYKRNLDAAFSQKYKKYTIIYMDDISTDNTGNLVEKYVKKKYPHKAAQFILIKNKIKRYCLGNYLFVIERFCPDNAVLITYDGDDWFANNNVLSYLNSVYQDKNVWLTYGNSLDYPSNKKCRFCLPLNPKLIEKNEIRENCKKNDWFVHHLRSFYTWLFRKIEYKDFSDENHALFKHTEDVAFMLPMIEMAGIRTKYLNKILYIYNRSNVLNTFNVFKVKKLKDTFSYICNKEKYQLLRDYNEN